MSTTPSNKVLIVGPSWVGDMVMAQSLFTTLHAADETVRIDVLAPPWTLPVLSRMPEVQSGIEMPLRHGELALAKRRQLARVLASRGYRQAIVLPNSFKSALIPYWARIPKRTGYVGELRWGLLNDARRLNKQRLRQTVQRFVALGREVGATLPDPIPTPAFHIQTEQVDAALQRLGLRKPSSPLLIACPGAEYGPAKRWPAEYFAELARGMLEDGWELWLLGSQSDGPVAEAICAAAPGCVNLVGKTSLGEAIDLSSLADVVVSNDSGLMHVAAATGRAVVAVYGSSDPGFTPPLTGRSRILYLALPCSPCFERECPLQHFRCMRDLQPHVVNQALRELAQCTR
jgi:heptosyltransferase-2